MTRRILARLPGVPVEVIQDREALKTSGRDRAAWLPEAKTTLLLAVQKGPFWRACPGTKDYICCGYQVLQVTLNCPMDCTYCVLQGYVNVPAITVFVNVEDLFDELETRWAEHPERVWRLGTGEFGDSLALDGLMGLNELLIPRFAGQRQAILEIKSKWPQLGASPLPGPQSPGHFRLVPQSPGDYFRRRELCRFLGDAPQSSGPGRGGGIPGSLSLRSPDLFPGLGRGLPANR